MIENEKRTAIAPGTLKHFYQTRHRIKITERTGER